MYRGFKCLRMRHATPKTLAYLEPLFVRLRKLPELTEKKTGVFYLKSKAFLHFHEHDGEVFADVRLNPPEFERLPATTKAEQHLLVKAIQGRLT